MSENEEKELLASGHRMCAGCGEGTAMRAILKEAGPNSIATVATGCLEVTTTAYPQTAWEIPLIHAAFENAASVASGIEAALKQMDKKGETNILSFAGDGGTFDIGFQALSGMFERKHNVTHICLDNEAYMNTGIQRCSSTPYGASTTTSPSGKESIGEDRPKKPIARIAGAHDIPYAATATIAYIDDLKKKVNKALKADGPAFLHVFAPCPTGWRHGSDDTIELARLAVETGVFVLWEAEDGEICDIKITKKPKERKPVKEYLKKQRRFAHLTEEHIEKIQKEVDEKCEQYGF